MNEPELNVWERAMGWRKRQMVKSQINEVSEAIRNNTLEEVAKEFEKMKNFSTFVYVWDFWTIVIDTRLFNQGIRKQYK